MSLCGHDNGGHTIIDNNHDNVKTVNQTEQVALSVSTIGVDTDNASGSQLRVLSNEVLFCFSARFGFQSDILDARYGK